MKLIAFVLILVYVSIFSSSILLSVLFPQSAGYIKVVLVAALWLVSFWLVVVYRCLKQQEIRFINQNLLILLFCVTAMVTISLASHVPIIPIIYGSITYISFYPLIYLLLIVCKSYHLTKALLIYFVFLCDFLAAGVIYDSYVGLYNAPFIGKQLAVALLNTVTKDFNGEVRASFLFESSTYVYPFLSIGILSAIMMVIIFRKTELIWLANFSILLIWLGCFFSFSRTPLILGTALAFYALIEISWNKTGISIVIGLIIVGLLALDIQSWLYSQLSPFRIQKLGSILSEFSSSSASSNSARLSYWQEGLQLLTSVDAWGGYGLSTSNIRMGQLYKLNLRSHYESSLLITFSEGGIIGMLARLIPLTITLKSSNRTLFKRIFIVWSLLFIVNLAVSPAIIAYSVHLAYFLGISMAIALAPILSIDSKAT